MTMDKAMRIAHYWAKRDGEDMIVFRIGKECFVADANDKLPSRAVFVHRHQTEK